MSPVVHERVLVTVTGPDTPGITAALTRVISENHVELLDIEQVVVAGQLVLALLLDLDTTPAHGEPVLKDLLFTAKKMGLELSFQVIARAEGEELGGERRRFAVTLMGEGDESTRLHVISAALADLGVNIENIRQLSLGQMSSVEIIVGSVEEVNQGSLRRALIEASRGHVLDLAVQRETVSRRSKRLVVMDMDSTLIRCEVINELAGIHGVGEQVAGITERAMAGELNFEESLRERVGLLKGLRLDQISALADDLPLTDGAESLIRALSKLGFKTAVISGGFTFAADALKKRLGLDYAYANELEVADGILTGQVLEPIITPQRKADLLDTIAQGQGITLEQTIAIGDGANDLPMLERAGLGIAFHAKAKLQAAADTTVSQGGLDRVLYLLGLRAREVRELLAGG